MDWKENIRRIILTITLLTARQINGQENVTDPSYNESTIEVDNLEDDAYVSYSGYSVMEASNLGPSTIGVLFQCLEDNLDIIQLHQDRITNAMQLAVPQNKVNLVTGVLESLNSHATILTSDLGTEIPFPYAQRRIEPLTRGLVTFDHYMNKNEIESYITSLAGKYPSLVSSSVIGRTESGNQIHQLTITNKNVGGPDKPIVFIDGGIHAREWVSPASVLYVVKTLLESPVLHNNLEWRIVPLLNPDGYEYSWTTDRLWRKNRRVNSGSSCRGADLNRNFDFHWMETGASSQPCSEVYAGQTAFSEAESVALRDAVKGVKERVKAYITVHSYGQMILHPYGYTNALHHPQEKRMKNMGEKMAAAMKLKTGSVFTVDSAGGALYTAAGGSDDFMSGGVNVPYSYTFELRDKGRHGFILPDTYIRSSGEELWAAMEVLGMKLLRNFGPELYRTEQLVDDYEGEDETVNKPVSLTPDISHLYLPYVNPFIRTEGALNPNAYIPIPVAYYQVPHLVPIWPGKK